ncbi:MAG: bifunctional phosphoribosylaminoimidazolecarboxamide formyltransferase/IMP cyclohydrolase [Dysgonamonadaceae bacterium]|nr:bifunctional phosphoribosylaminoimidazolecarboxamide formyltransferase/IMP cyclohydrolase [Dysgonamonadaceae bacterium]
MFMSKKINNALISVYDKGELDEILSILNRLNVSLISTGGTQEYIQQLGYECKSVEEVTSYPPILGGRVKTLHPKIFGGILYRREIEADKKIVKSYDIPSIDLVIVDLYPFEKTLALKASHDEIIEKIDIGGISLIRAGAKNYKDVIVVASKNQYGALQSLLHDKKGESELEDRKWFAKEAFAVTSAYDSAIFSYFTDNDDLSSFRVVASNGRKLRYGENPHQEGYFYGNFEELFSQLHGKEISYNNLLDIEAATELMAEFSEPSIAIIKHNNACGMASRTNLLDAWKDALEGDPVSAFGGVIIANERIEKEVAEEINRLFFEIIIAPSYDDEALEILKQKKNRIILEEKQTDKKQDIQFRSLLNGVLAEQKNKSTQTSADLKVVTTTHPTPEETEDLLFANKMVKHLKSNAIALVKSKQLIGIGTGQTSRVDALMQAIEKAKQMGLDLNGAVMASDAFFPFPDSVEIAHKAGITAIIQPGGSIKDQESIDYCNQNGIAMVTTGIRHFKH